MIAVYYIYIYIYIYTVQSSVRWRSRPKSGSLSRSTSGCPGVTPPRCSGRPGEATSPAASPTVALVRRRRASAAVGSSPGLPHARQEGVGLVKRQPWNQTDISFGHNTWQTGCITPNKMQPLNTLRQKANQKILLRWILKPRQKRKFLCTLRNDYGIKHIDNACIRIK